jgi:hypothetical protein
MLNCTNKYNFVENKAYEQYDITADEKTASVTCSNHPNRAGRDYFFQQHTNGHTICGFYNDRVTDDDDLAKHGHKFGGVCTFPEPKVEIPRVGNVDIPVLVKKIGVSSNASTDFKTKVNTGTFSHDGSHRSPHSGSMGAQRSPGVIDHRNSIPHPHPVKNKCVKLNKIYACIDINPDHSEGRIIDTLGIDRSTIDNKKLKCYDVGIEGMAFCAKSRRALHDESLDLYKEIGPTVLKTIEIMRNA